MNGFWREMKNLGKDPNPFRAGFLQFVGVAENRDKAFDLYREPAEYFYIITGAYMLTRDMPIRQVTHQKQLCARR